MPNGRNFDLPNGLLTSTRALISSMNWLSLIFSKARPIIQGMTTRNSETCATWRMIEAANGCCGSSSTVTPNTFRSTPSR
jgi:hypothetical protein